jgi:hypothetical protein
VFEFIAAADRPARPRAALPLVLSIVVHAAAVVVLFTISLTLAPKGVAPSRIRAITLLEPVPRRFRLPRRFARRFDSHPQNLAFFVLPS